MDPLCIANIPLSGSRAALFMIYCVEIFRELIAITTKCNKNSPQRENNRASASTKAPAKSLVLLTANPTFTMVIFC